MTYILNSDYAPLPTPMTYILNSDYAPLPTPMTYIPNATLMTHEAGRVIIANNRATSFFFYRPI